MAFPDVVADLIAHLDPVDGVPVASDIPKSRPDEFIQIRRIGGPADPPVKDVARLDVFAWAKSSPRAMELLLLVRASIWQLGGNDGTALGYPIYRVVEFMGPNQTDDPDTGTPRGWYRPELTVRADDVIHFT